MVPVVVLLLAMPGAQAAPPEIYLVSAGNNLGLGDEPALRFAEDDANRFAVIMERLGGIHPQNSLLLMGETAATLRKVILDTNARIRVAMREGRDAVLLVFFSGHADARGLHLGETVLPFDELQAMVKGSPATVQILVVDSCRSGGVTRVKGAVPAREFDIQMQDRLNAEGLAVITSSAEGENSYESEHLRASFFSHHLINGLRGAADDNRDGRVTLAEAYQYTYRQTLRSSGQTLNLQHPTYLYDIKGKGDLVLTALANDRDRSGRLLVLQPGLYLVYESDETGQVVAEVAVDPEGSRLILPAGDYFVQKRGRNHYVEYRFSLEPGREVDLGKVDSRKVEYARLVRKGGGDQLAIHGLYLLGGSRGDIGVGSDPVPHLILGTSLDLPWLSLGLRARFARSEGTSEDGLVDSTHDEYAAGFTAERYLDLPWLSLSLGLLVEVAYNIQTYQTSGTAPDRHSFSFGLGVLARAEIEIVSGLIFLAEGGPLTHVYQRSEVRAGREIGSTVSSPLTWWVAGGLGWRF
jgi:hypothetical protein